MPFSMVTFLSVSGDVSKKIPYIYIYMINNKISHNIDQGI